MSGAVLFYSGSKGWDEEYLIVVKTNPVNILEITKEIFIYQNDISGNHFKGYLHYKTITSQNVPSKAQIKNFLIS